MPSIHPKPRRVSLKPTLPIEIWATIFTFTDSRTLWTSVRRLSRSLCLEAEREFHTARIHRLRVEWSFSVLVPPYDWYFATQLHTTAVKHMSQNDRMSVFGLRIVTDEWTFAGIKESVVSAFEEGNVEQTPWVEDRVLKAIGARDGGKGVVTRTWFEGEDGDFEGEASDVLWNTVDLKQTEIELDWRGMLDSLLAEKCVMVETFQDEVNG